MFKVYAITDIGKERNENQDGVFVDGIRVSKSFHRQLYYETDSDYIHLAICDGVGSTKYASEAVECSLEFLSTCSKLNNEEEITEMIVALNEYVYLKMNELRMEGATTIAGVIINKNAAYVYNIGDTLVFTINGGYLEKQTIDDVQNSTFGEEQIDADGIHIKAPLIQSIGTSRLIEKVHVKKMVNENSFIICSDGISDLLGIDGMEDVINSSSSLKDISELMVNESLNNGGYDNCSIIIAVQEEC